MNELTHKHGGDLDAVEAAYGIPKDQIIDFSGNVNPLGFPPHTARALAEHIALVSRYPDKGYRKLRESIGRYTGADPETIVVGNGSTELISGFIGALCPRCALILGPAYSEYENSVRVCGGSFTYFPLKEEDDFRLDLPALLAALTPETDLFVMCNPNNPTGTAVTVPQLREILTHCQANHTAVLVDETYIEFADDLSSLCAIPLTREFDNLFVIRGISKFFAAPGLRLGYGVCGGQPLREALSRKKDPWSVNSLAAFAGETLFSETEFMQQTRALILSERKKLLAELKSWDTVKVYPTASNFILIRLLTQKITAAAITDRLIRRKMLVRDAASFTFLDESYLRFCIQLPEQNEALLASLREFLG